MNLSEQNKWMDKIFRKKLGNYEMHAESHIWDNIAKRLDDQKRRPVLFGSWWTCLLYTSPSPRDRTRSRMPSSA